MTRHGVRRYTLHARFPITVVTAFSTKETSAKQGTVHFPTESLLVCMMLWYGLCYVYKTDYAMVCDMELCELCYGVNYNRGLAVL